jgi:hypothetical protein
MVPDLFSAALRPAIMRRPGGQQNPRERMAMRSSRLFKPNSATLWNPPGSVNALDFRTVQVIRTNSRGMNNRI